MKQINKKLILDASCGGRMMWFNKKHPNAIYIDNRKLGKGIFSTHPNFEVAPDILMDFRKMKFKDNSFSLVVWDPPHMLSLTKNSYMAKKYGILNKETYKKDLQLGFKECLRVLKKNGILVFKWSEAESSRKRSISAYDVIRFFEVQPLFGSRSGKGNTHWFCYMKL